MMGIIVSGGYSGAHLNPAVTLALYVWRGFPGKRVVPYWVAQVLGAFLGAAIGKRGAVSGEREAELEAERSGASRASNE